MKRDNKLNPFKIKNNFETYSQIPSIPIFENRLKIKPFLTIAIPTFLRGKYLGDAIESARYQETNIVYEIIVVDNNPIRNDVTEKLMQQYKDIQGISYFKNSQNIGMTGNFNRLYELADAEWVVMLHDDDMLYPNYITITMNIIQLTKAALVFPSYSPVFDITDKVTGFTFVTVKKNDVYRGNFIGPPTGMTIAKAIMLKLGGFDDNYYPSQDYEFYWRAVYNGIRVVKGVGTKSVYYRIGVNESLKEDTVLGFISVENKVFQRIVNNKNHIIKIILENYFKSWRWRNTEQHSKILKSSNGIITLAQEQKGNETISSKIIFQILNFYFRADLRLRIIFNSIRCSIMSRL